MPIRVHSLTALGALLCAGCASDGLHLTATWFDDGTDVARVRVELSSDRSDDVYVHEERFELELVDGSLLPASRCDRRFEMLSLCETVYITAGAGSFSSVIDFGRTDARPAAVVFRSVNEDETPVEARVELDRVAVPRTCPDGTAYPRVGECPAPCTPPAHEVDLLFMIDNSSSMSEEQHNLVRALPRFVTTLMTGDLDADGDVAGDLEPDDLDFPPPVRLQIGVVTSDMGTGGSTVPTCSNSMFGDDGLLSTVGDLTRSGCDATYPSFLGFFTGGDPTRFASDVACVMSTGTQGCGFEQPLEAVLKALSPTVDQPWTATGFAAPRFFMDSEGNGDVENAGFVQFDSVLAIVMLTDEDDCSARDPDLYDVRSTTYPDDPNLRCVVYEEEALHPIARYVDGLIQLRRAPGHLVFAPIVGIPADLAPMGFEPVDYARLVSDDPTVRDERMVPRVDPANPQRMLTSCREPATGLAYPPTRIARVAEGLERRGAQVTVRSICEPDLGWTMTGVLDRIREALDGTCAEGR
ncbi:MAG: hypothetical protein AB7S26_42335 [Sandaracinaceae bacterium]